MITVTVIGTEQVQARSAEMPDRVHRALEAKIYDLGQKLRNHVIQDKLSGQVLNKITGRLQGSIQTDLIENTATRITGRVYSSTAVNYAAIHEYGGLIRTRLGSGRGPPKKGGKAFATMPERSFLRSSLADYRQQIIDGMADAVKKAVAEK